MDFKALTDEKLQALLIEEQNALDEHIAKTRVRLREIRIERDKRIIAARTKQKILDMSPSEREAIKLLLTSPAK